MAVLFVLIDSKGGGIGGWMTVCGSPSIDTIAAAQLRPDIVDGEVIPTLQLLVTMVRHWGWGGDLPVNVSYKVGDIDLLWEVECAPRCLSRLPGATDLCL